MMKKFIALAAAIVVLLSTSSCRDAEEILEVPEVSISAKKINDTIKFNENEMIIKREQN